MIRPNYLDEYLPPGMEDFPWKDSIHWMEFSGWDTRFCVDYVPEDPGATAQEIIRFANDRHLEVWAWLEPRFMITELPALVASGRSFVWHGKQVYAYVQAAGTFSLGERKTADPQP